MREYMFRAWDSRTKKWICEGYHVLGEATLFRMIEGYLYENKEDGQTVLERLIDVTECQSTGRKDRNGKEIYEGDIVKYFNPYDCCDDLNYIFHPDFGKDVPAEIEHVHTNAYGEKTLRRYNPLIGVVEWDKVNLTYAPIVPDEYHYEVSFLLHCEDNYDENSADDRNRPRSFVEVIGNVFENPELLKP